MSMAAIAGSAFRRTALGTEPEAKLDTVLSLSIIISPCVIARYYILHINTRTEITVQVSLIPLSDSNILPAAWYEIALYQLHPAARATVLPSRSFALPQLHTAASRYR